MSAIRSSLLCDGGAAHGVGDGVDSELADRFDQPDGPGFSRRSDAEGGGDADRTVRPAVP